MKRESLRSRAIDTHFLSSVYDALKRGEQIEFRPKLRQDVGIVYDIFGVELQEDKVRTYYDRGLIEVVGDVSFPSCPVCGNLCLHIFLLCPECSSRNIDKKDLLTHYECGYTGSIDLFDIDGTGVYRCPNCGKQLKRVGIDFGRPGFGFICLDCSAVFQIPLVEIECEKKHTSRVQQLEIKRYPVYRLSENSKKLSQVLDIAEYIAEELRSLGLRVTTFAHVRGMSGAVYTIPIYIEGDPSLIIEIAPKDVVDERYPFLVSIEAIDIPNSAMLLILPKDTLPELETIFNPEKIKVVKVEDLPGSVGIIVDEILKMLGERILGKT